MRKTILEARVFVSSYPLAHERVVKDYEIDIECTDNRLYTHNGKSYKLRSGDVLIRTPGSVVSSIGNQKSYLLTLDFSEAKHSLPYSRNIGSKIQPLTNGLVEPISKFTPLRKCSKTAICHPVATNFA